MNADLLLQNAAAVAGLMVVFWLISLPVKNVGLIDIAWGLGFVLVAWTTFLATDSDGPTRWLLPVLTTLWGLRLSGYLAWRNVGAPEDRRYATMREKWPAFPLTSLPGVFLLQAGLLLVVALPLQSGIARSSDGWSLLHVLGILLWGAGLFFESVGDFQLARFKSRPENEGAVMDRGLWRYTRHPNYFGDFLVWWGLFLVAAGGGAALWTVVSPLLMSVLLMRVSGVTLLEKSLQERKPKYADYVRRTNAFFPGPPSENPQA